MKYFLLKYLNSYALYEKNFEEKILRWENLIFFFSVLFDSTNSSSTVLRLSLYRWIFKFEGIKSIFALYGDVYFENIFDSFLTLSFYFFHVFVIMTCLPFNGFHGFKFRIRLLFREFWNIINCIVCLRNFMFCKDFCWFIKVT